MTQPLDKDPSGQPNPEGSSFTRAQLISGAAGAVIGFFVGSEFQRTLRRNEDDQTPEAEYLGGLTEQIDAPEYKPLLPGIEIRGTGLTTLIRIDPDEFERAGKNIGFLMRSADGDSEIQIGPGGGSLLILVARRGNEYAMSRGYYDLIPGDFNGKPALLSDIKISVHDDFPGGPERESSYIELVQRPLIGRMNDVVAAADHTPGIDETKAQGNLFKAAVIGGKVNKYIAELSRDDPSTYRAMVSEMNFYSSQGTQIYPHSYSTNLEKGVISGSTDELAKESLFLAGVMHESLHMLFPALTDDKKQQLYGALRRFRELAGNKPSIEPYSSGLLGPDPIAEKNPIYNVFDESAVFTFPRVPGSTVGHPYGDVSEMFSSGIAVMTYAPDKVEELLAKLPEDKRSAMIQDVIKPCIDVLGDKHGPELMGGSYERFKIL